MSLFSWGGDKKSTTTYSTTNTITDQSASAAEGSVAVGAGANVNITDGGATKAALEANRDVTGMALVTQRDTSAAALDANRDVAGMALVTQRDTAAQALDTTAKVAGSALNLGGEALRVNRDVAELAVNANRDVNIRSLETTSNLANAAINTVAGMGEIASRERVDVMRTTDLAIQTQRGLSEKIADLAGASLERAQTPDSAVTKQLLWVVGIVAAVLGFAFLSKGKSQ